MLCAFRENFGENFRRERPKIVHSRSRKTRIKPSKTGKPLPKSQLDFESFSLRPLRYISIFSLYSIAKKRFSVNCFFGRRTAPGACGKAVPHALFCGAGPGCRLAGACGSGAEGLSFLPHFRYNKRAIVQF